jgi:hypothetical protein
MSRPNQACHYIWHQQHEWNIWGASLHSSLYAGVSAYRRIGCQQNATVSSISNGHNLRDVDRDMPLPKKGAWRFSWEKKQDFPSRPFRCTGLYEWVILIKCSLLSSSIPITTVTVSSMSTSNQRALSQRVENEEVNS